MRNIIIIFSPISFLFSQNLFSSSGVHISGTNADKPSAVFAEDLDGDGDIDILSASTGDNKISWYENDGTTNPSFTFHNITAAAREALDVFAIDFKTTIKKTGSYIVGEAVLIKVDVPDTFTQQYGTKQVGAFIDVVQPILKRKVLDWDNATLNLAARFDYVDWNVGTFNETQTDIGDNLWAITPAISFRPSAQTVFRLNYRYQWQKDILNNSAAKTATWLFGFSTYF